MKIQTTITSEYITFTRNQQSFISFFQYQKTSYIIRQKIFEYFKRISIHLIFHSNSSYWSRCKTPTKYSVVQSHCEYGEYASVGFQRSNWESRLPCCDKISQPFDIWIFKLHCEPSHLRKHAIGEHKFIYLFFLLSVITKKAGKHCHQISVMNDNIH